MSLPLLTVNSYLHILLHRQAYTKSQTESNIFNGRPALQAACRVTRIVEDMLSQNLVQFGQMHLYAYLNYRKTDFNKHFTGLPVSFHPFVFTRLNSSALSILQGG